MDPGQSQDEQHSPAQTSKAKLGSLPVALFLLVLVAGGLYLIIEMSQGSSTHTPTYFFDELFEAGEFVQPTALVVRDDQASVELHRQSEDWQIVGLEEARVALDPVRAFVQRLSSLRFEEALLLGPRTDDFSGTTIEIRSSKGRGVTYTVADDDRVVREGDARVFRVKGLQLPAQPKAWVTKTLSLLNPRERALVERVRVVRSATERGELEIERKGERDWRFAAGAEGLAHRGRCELILSTLYGFRVLDYRSNATLERAVDVELGFSGSQPDSLVYHVEEPETGESEVWLQFEGESGAYLVEAAIARAIAPTLSEVQGKPKRGRVGSETQRPRPERVAIALIVIGYQGLEWPQTVSSISRTKTDALAFARELHFQVSAGRANFEALAREESDYLDPDDPYGKVTTHGPYSLSDDWFSEVDDVVFDLELGEIYPEVLDTSRGFFIVQRIE